MVALLKFGRIWKYDVVHASYDLFAILVQSPPEPLAEKPKGCCGTLWEAQIAMAWWGMVGLQIMNTVLWQLRTII